MILIGNSVKQIEILNLKSSKNFCLEIFVVERKLMHIINPYQIHKVPFIVTRADLFINSAMDC